MRNRGWRRKKDFSKAKRKMEINKTYCSNNNINILFYDNLHQYSKNKIHCSCPLCSAKTRNIGNSISDERKKDSLDSQMEDY